MILVSFHDEQEVTDIQLRVPTVNIGMVLTTSMIGGTVGRWGSDVQLAIEGDNQSRIASKISNGNFQEHENHQLDEVISVVYDNADKRAKGRL